MYGHFHKRALLCTCAHGASTPPSLLSLSLSRACNSPVCPSILTGDCAAQANQMASLVSCCPTTVYTGCVHRLCVYTGCVQAVCTQALYTECVYTGCVYTGCVHTGLPCCTSCQGQPPWPSGVVVSVAALIFTRSWLQILTPTFGRPPLNPTHHVRLCVHRLCGHRLCGHISLSLSLSLSFPGVLICSLSLSLSLAVYTSCHPLSSLSRASNSPVCLSILTGDCAAQANSNGITGELLSHNCLHRLCAEHIAISSHRSPQL